ncbi:hypothetical protein ZWY2020_001972 [Hordeum vulgare]|nr:hypothetical protein ZWY2020_001972 [Hordeum vulgare]
MVRRLPVRAGSTTSSSSARNPTARLTAPRRWRRHGLRRAHSKQTIVIPKGDFLTGALNFTGPCKGDGVTIKLEGNLLASNDLSKFPSNWIEIMRIKNLVITGKGSIDGQGKAVWTKNSCQKNYNCKILPNSLVLDFCDDALIEGISIINSKFFHMNIYECKGVTVKDVKVSAPGDSPNTDGIHMGDSSNVNIIDTTIAVGGIASPSAPAPNKSTSAA